jgi:hypothetical protein
MESCTVTIPTVTALCCQQVQLIPMGRLVHDVVWHLGSAHAPMSQGILSGRIRLCMQVIACIYVLSFATIVSVTTGYAAQLTGYYGYDTEQASQLQPVSALSRAGMILPFLRDRDRIGISHLPMYASQKIIFPTHITTASGVRYPIADFLESSCDVDEPYGTLIDCECCSLLLSLCTYLSLTIILDYYTCMGILEWARGAPLNNSRTSYYLGCSWHECSCSVSGSDLESDRRTEQDDTTRMIFADMESNITVDRKRWNLAGPPLTIGLGSLYESIAAPEIDSGAIFTKATDFWYGRKCYFSMSTLDSFQYTNGSTKSSTPYAIDINGTVADTDVVVQTGRCVAQDAYSWGFSSLLLLTLCSYTIFFALALILLQTDVYWNSRHDRFHQHHSIYTDVLYIAEELKNAFCHDGDAHIRSTQVFGARVERRKQGLCLDVDELLLSRWQEWRLLLSLATATTAEHTDERMHELRTLKGHDCALGVQATGYGENAAVAEDGSGLEVGKDSRRNSAAGN